MITIHSTSSPFHNPLFRHPSRSCCFYFLFFFVHLLGVRVTGHDRRANRRVVLTRPHQIPLRISTNDGERQPPIEGALIMEKDMKKKTHTNPKRSNNCHGNRRGIGKSPDFLLSFSFIPSLTFFPFKGPFSRLLEPQRIPL